MSFVVLIYYLLLTTNYSGRCYSVRWFLPFLPFLYFFMYPFMRDFTRRRRGVFIALFALSTIIAAIGWIRPWSGLLVDDWAIVDNLREIAGILFQ